MRFEIKDESIVAIYNEVEAGKVQFKEEDKSTILLYRTFVDPKYRSLGLAAQLLEIFYKHAKKLDKKVITTCWYAEKWFRENKDKQDILK